jgi:hypothetical protein
VFCFIAGQYVNTAIAVPHAIDVPLSRTVVGTDLVWILIYNPRHLLATLNEYVRHYNEHRPHQCREHRPPALDMSPALVADLATTRVRRRRVLNGMIYEYSQAA